MPVFIGAQSPLDSLCSSLDNVGLVHNKCAFWYNWSILFEIQAFSCKARGKEWLIISKTTNQHIWGSFVGKIFRESSVDGGWWWWQVSDQNKWKPVFLRHRRRQIIFLIYLYIIYCVPIDRILKFHTSISEEWFVFERMAFESN